MVTRNPNHLKPLTLNVSELIAAGRDAHVPPVSFGASTTAVV